MKANLFINFYKDKQPTRQAELVACLIKNYLNHELDRMIIVISESDKEYLKQVFKDNGIKNTSKAYVIIKNNRPSYNYYFVASHQYPDDINMIANTDIVIDDANLRRLKRWNWRNYCLALSRWDYLDNSMDSTLTRHYANRDSQDIWIIKGRFKNIPEANFPLGIPSCDNKIAYLLDRYHIVINPSRSIRTFHYHLTNIRNYVQSGKDRIALPKPYKLLPPSKLPL